jgi:predicted outer membrane repeat protein
MTKRQRRQKRKQRRHEPGRSPVRREITIGAGLALGATLGVPAGANAADYLVTNTSDAFPSAPAGSLRAAMATADMDPTPDRVLFQSGLSGTITLAGALPDLDYPTQIVGPGPGQITINGNGHQIMYIDPGPGGDVAISGLTLSGGFAPVDGGAIRCYNADLTIADSVIAGNTVSGSPARGGGISIIGGNLTLLSSTLSGNTTTEDGGGIFSQNGSVNISNSTIDNNHAGSGFDSGGGIWSTGAGLSIENSTFYRNSAGYRGGGIYASTTSPATIDSTTVSNNSAAYYGGGIWAFTSPTAPTVTNTIAANNTAGSIGPDLNGDFNAAFSLIENTSGATVNSSVPGSNIVGQDPQLGALASNGGPTRTMALPQASPAVDKGSSALSSDQRGLPRPVDFLAIPNATGGNGADIGAFELQLASNQFSFGKVKRNLRKGTAKLTVKVPGPGILKLRGRGLKPQRAPGAALASKVVSAAGKVKLMIKSKGRKRRKLNRTGKVKVKAKVTYTPTGGNPNTKTKKIKLKKRL